MAAGDFSVSALQQIMLKAEAMWSDSRLAQDYKAHAETAIAVKQHSTATFRALEDSDTDNTVKVTFLNPCAIDVQDCTSNCDISGAEMETKAKTYALDLCKEVNFSVDAQKTRTGTYSVEEQAARGLALAVKKLDEWWSAQNLVKMHAFAGPNVSPEPGTYAAGTTTIANNLWNLSLIAEIQFDAMMNKLVNPFYVNNGDLWVAYQNAKLQAGNAEGKGDAARIQQLDLTFDPWNFGAAGITDDLFAVSSSAMAFVTRTKNPDRPTVLGGTIQQTRYTVPSSIPGVRYDVFYALKCVTDVNGQEHIMHSWKVQTLGGIFLNPEGCDVVVGGNTYSPTGILSYTHGA